MKNKNVTQIIIRTAALLLSVLFITALSGCDDGGSLDDYIAQHGLDGLLSGSDPSVTQPEMPVTSDSDHATGTTTAPPQTGFLYELPENLIGSWSVVDIYQTAIASDISEQEALRREQLYGISLSIDTFSRYDELVTDAVFKINLNSNFSDMQNMGIQTAPLSGLYGNNAPVTSVEIQTADGFPCTTVFLVNNSILIAFGQGMNVFSYELVEAVG